MKTILSFVFAGTLLFAAAACQREQQVDTKETNEVKEVTTQFVLNIAAAPATKMTADAVQLNQNFRGIKDAKLYVYKKGVGMAIPYVLGTETSEEKEFAFGSLFSSDGLDNTGDNNQTGENDKASRRVLQLSIPVGVNAVSFYGRADRSGSATDAQVGATNESATTISGTPSSTVIAAKKILSSEDIVNKYDATARLMIGVINDILGQRVDDEPDGEYGALPAVSWAQYGHQYEIDHRGGDSRYSPSIPGIAIGHSLNGLEEILGECYYLFTYILPVSVDRPHGEYRAGSSHAVKRMIIDMYRTISATANADPTDIFEENAQRLARVILDRAALYFDVNTGDYKSVAEIKSLVVTSYHVYTEDQWNEKYGGAQNLNGYPFEDFGVPEGAAQLGFHVYGSLIPSTDTANYDLDHPDATYSKDEFYYHHPNFPLVNPTMETFEPRKYLYPAELWYHANSPIRTTINEVTIASFPDGLTPWNTSSSWTGWTFPGTVESATRGVAIANNINYGVAMLKTRVEFTPGVTALQDNRAALTNNVEQNKTISTTDAQLELRGVLVGGVNPRMNWQFIRKYTSTGNHEGLGDLSLFDGVIYDHTIASSTIPTPVGTPNYTLVYDNYNSSDASQNDVYVALEIVNNGDAFYGRDNLIPNGGVFYLVAKIDKPSESQISGLSGYWPTDHQIPPIYGQEGEEVPDGETAGESKKIARVFIQDFVTSVTFRIGATSLQKAYYSVPDLRASQMALGLSVDLQWIPGLEYIKEF